MMNQVLRDEMDVVVQSHEKFENLNDAAIRRTLIARLKLSSVPPKKIAEELHVHNGRAVADVVALYNEAHCYEIKGQTDNVRRVAQQFPYFDLAFPKSTLVTTENHLRVAEKVLPAHWGIMKASSDGAGGVKLSYVRASVKNPLFDERTALLTLWKNEMQEILRDLGTDHYSRSTRHQLIELILEYSSKREIAQKIAEQLAGR